MRPILFVCNAVKWFDKVNGNTYHSVRITRTSDGEVLTVKIQYGYGDSYRHTALGAMLKAGWLQNYQRKDGTIEVPKILRKYVPFKEIKK